MKSIRRLLFPGAALAFFCGLTLVAFAQEAPKPDDTPPPPPPAASEQPAPAAAVQSPAAPASPAPTEAAPEAPSAAPADSAPADAKEEAPELRRLDTPDNAPAPPMRRARGHASRHGGDNDRVGIGHDVAVGKGETIGDAVSIIGTATNEGEVRGSLVSVVGATTSNGNVGDSAVAILGSNYVNGKVGDTVVAVLGDVELGPHAEVGGDVVCIGGTLRRDPGAVVHGSVNNVMSGVGFGHTDGLLAWFRNCALLGRPLAFAPHLGWAWAMAMAFFVFYLVLALLFPRAVAQCAQTLETHPGFSILSAILVVLIAPIAIVLLCITVVGIAAVPFVVTGLLLAALFGKATMLAWIGRRLTKFFGDGPLGATVVAVLVGGVIVLALYLVPFVGFLTMKLLGWLGLGVVVYTLMLSTRREKPAPAVVLAGAVPVEPMPAGAEVAGATMTGEGGMGGFGATPAAAGAVPPSATPPLVVAATLPRAGFWLRIGALFIDVILVAILLGFLNSMLPAWPWPHFRMHPPELLPALAIYGALMWKFRGTTIGGIVCGLKIVRLDQRELDWATAIVRALSCFLSLVLAGLGFIWIAIDDDKQSWHDKIAGTVVVRVPKGVSLV